MWNRGGIRSSALERAKAQLSGQRITNSGTSREAQGRDVTSHEKALQSRQIPLHGVSHFSSDTESENQDHHNAYPVKTVPRIAETVEQFGMGGGRRFLKKSAKKVSSPADTSEVMFIPQRGSQNVALSKFAQIEARIRNHTNSKLSLDTSADLKSSLPVKSSSELSAAGRNQFLNTKVSTPNGQEESERPPADLYMASDIQKGISMDSDEEEMRRLLGELFDSPNGVKAKGQKEMSPQQAGEAYKKSSKDIMLTAEHKEKQPVHSAFTAQHHTRLSPSPPSSRNISTPSRPFFQTTGRSSCLSSAPDHSEIKSLEELFPITSDHDDTQSERSVFSDDFKVNVMTLDDLAPETPNIAKVDPKSSQNYRIIFDNMFKCYVGNLQYDIKPEHPDVSSAGEILHKPKNEVQCYESDFESEIQTETAQSVDDVSEHLSGGNENSFKASEPQSESLSAKLNSDENTLSEKPSKSASIPYSRSESSLSHSQGSDTSSYSSDATHTSTSPQSPSVRQHKKDATVQTQTAGLAYLYSSDQAMLGPSVGMSFVDPTPIASHVISAEAVEALTAYTPAVFALNDMLRQQLTLTRNFIQSSRHLHQTMLEALGPPDFIYTTLEDTKEFIRCNRPSKLTVEEALEEVLQEMRDYHYI
ncbi:hypothetical protein Baya_3284 [Bagarius yarrelli]|uniref:DUF4614 domain-containing protein n=1 Tax=Bagarius yarrelli TaxID=175774 RepID=A0A556TS65_BAGYA|nr:hypothetical protein Baya_3284 [Bagarius yarrelli]